MLVYFFFTRYRISLLKTMLRFLDFIGETELGPVLARHQIVVHTTAEIFLGNIATHRILIIVLGQAAHIFDHCALAAALMVQRKTAPLRGRRREQLL